MTYEEVSRADRNYEYFFGDLNVLMQNAGKRVAEYTEEKFGHGKNVLVVVGSGNNGGDGIVAATVLTARNTVSVFPAAGLHGMKTRESREALKQYRGKFIDRDAFLSDVGKYDVIIDALFGSGFRGEPKPPLDSIISTMNGAGTPIISVDVPSALGSAGAVVPTATVTFTDVKEGMNRENSGNIIVADIGIPEKVFTHNGPGEFVYYRRSGKNSHKGMNGRVSIVGGWTFHGSAIIAGRGAIKSGCDLVRIFSTSQNYGIISSYDPGLIVRNLEITGDYGEIAGNDSILIGSGLGKNQDLAKVLSGITHFQGVIVLDAEGLDWLPAIRKAAPDAKLILTPHSGEFKRISGLEAEKENAKKFAHKIGAVVLLKGAEDMVTDGEHMLVTEGGNPRMTMGGTGDLLAGLTLGISARSLDPFRAACMASFLNKSAGDFAMRQKSLWYDINDMIEAVPHLMGQFVR